MLKRLKWKLAKLMGIDKTLPSSIRSLGDELGFLPEDVSFRVYRRNTIRAMKYIEKARSKGKLPSKFLGRKTMNVMIRKDGMYIQVNEAEPDKYVHYVPCAICDKTRLVCSGTACCAACDDCLTEQQVLCIENEVENRCQQKLQKSRTNKAARLLAGIKASGL